MNPVACLPDTVIANLQHIFIENAKLLPLYPFRTESTKGENVSSYMSLCFELEKINHTAQ